MKSLREIISQLPLTTTESQHFRIHYGFRNPQKGRGLGAHGIQNLSLVRTYLNSLELLYNKMTSPPWNRTPPVVGDSGKTEVYIFDTSELFLSDGSPLTAANKSGVPYICLQSRSFEPTIQAEIHRAEAEAIHEATHVFNHREHPLMQSVHWAWVDEAVAVLMETLLIAGNYDHFRFLRNWIDMPEVSLDDWDSRYQAGMFACYLEKNAPGLLNRVWTESKHGDMPLEIMERLMPSERKLISPGPDEKDLFASGYCLDSYFPLDKGNDGPAPELFTRFGGRSVTESFRLQAGSQGASEIYQLNHLSCRYFKIDLKGAIRRLQIGLQAEEGQVIAPLKAEVAIVTEEAQKGEVAALRPSVKSSATPPRLLSVELNHLDHENIDHLALVVSNCGTRAEDVRTYIPHDDHRKFRVIVSAS